MERFELKEGEKFALLAIENVRSELPADNIVQLFDGTWVLAGVPVDIERSWQESIGRLRVESLRRANFVLLRSKLSTDPRILNREHYDLSYHCERIFSMLQLSGGLEYEGAALLAGSFLSGESQIRQISQLANFKHTRGSVPVPLNLSRLEQAAQFRETLTQVESDSPDFKRVIRGLNVLMDGTMQTHGQDRIHQFVRSLEALILPETGRTTKHFVHRCQTFAKASTQSRPTLQEAFNLRSDTEHLQDWDRSLQSYPVGDRENVALQRTRQMERLACFAYSRILGNEPVRSHFRNDATQRHFWEVLDDKSRKAIWGEQLDLTAIKLVRNYDQWGRAKPDRSPYPGGDGLS